MLVCLAIMNPDVRQTNFNLLDHIQSVTWGSFMVAAATNPFKVWEMSCLSGGLISRKVRHLYYGFGSNFFGYFIHLNVASIANFTFKCWAEGLGYDPTKPLTQQICAFGAGLVTGPVNALSQNPAVYSCRNKIGLLEAVSKIYIERGWLGFVRAAIPTTIRDGVGMGVAYGTGPIVYKKLKADLCLPEGIASIISSATAGVLYVATTQPLQRVRVHLQLHPTATCKQAFSITYRTEGFLGFYKGSCVRLVAMSIMALWQNYAQI